jgi:hypothetical protein
MNSLARRCDRAPMISASTTHGRHGRSIDVSRPMDCPSVGPLSIAVWNESTTGTSRPTTGGDFLKLSWKHCKAWLRSGEDVTGE